MLYEISQKSRITTQYCADFSKEQRSRKKVIHLSSIHHHRVVKARKATRFPVLKKKERDYSSSEVQAGLVPDLFH